MARAANPFLPQQLMTAAAAVFAEHGLAHARVADITARAGTSKGAFYLHFASKEALYVAIARDFLADVIAQLERFDEVAYLGLTPAALDRLAELDTAFCDFLWDRRQPLAMVLEGAAGTPCAFLSDEFLDSIQTHMRQSMQRQQDKLPSEFAAAIDPDFGAMLATGIIFMSARRMARSAAKLDLASQITQFRRTMLFGFAQARTDDSSHLETA